MGTHSWKGGGGGGGGGGVSGVPHAVAQHESENAPAHYPKHMLPTKLLKTSIRLPEALEDMQRALLMQSGLNLV